MIGCYWLEPQEDYCEDYFEDVACRWMCCIDVNNSDALKIVDMLDEHTSTIHKLVNKMKQEAFVEKKMDEDVKTVRMNAKEGSNNGRECKENLEETIKTRKTISTSSKSDKVKTLVSSKSAQVNTTSDSGVVTSVSYYYTEFGAFLM
jgi:ABC-type proline/glycine betaine transport system ATPase subunit